MYILGNLQLFLDSNLIAMFPMKIKRIFVLSQPKKSYEKFGNISFCQSAIETFRNNYLVILVSKIITLYWLWLVNFICGKGFCGINNKHLNIKAGSIENIYFTK